MNRRLLLCLAIVLLACAAFAFYITYEPTPSIAPRPVETPVVPPKRAVEPPKAPQPPVASEELEDDEDLQPQTHTVRTRLKKDNLVKQQETPDTSISLKKEKAREIVPGVTIEDKELSIQLEKENESLNIRRSKTSDEQMQMLWKQKF